MQETYVRCLELIVLVGIRSLIKQVLTSPWWVCLLMYSNLLGFCCKKLESSVMFKYFLMYSQLQIFLWWLYLSKAVYVEVWYIQELHIRLQHLTLNPLLQCYQTVQGCRKHYHIICCPWVTEYWEDAIIPKLLSYVFVYRCKISLLFICTFTKYDGKQSSK